MSSNQEHFAVLMKVEREHCAKAIERAVAAEREACARIAEGLQCAARWIPQTIAEQIRARGQNEPAGLPPHPPSPVPPQTITGQAQKEPCPS